MNTQPITKAKNAFDWLCWILVIFASLCLAASVPQTFTMVRVAHDDFGSSILVVVLEVMAFFALLAPLWVPAWTKTFDRIAYTLLGITTLGNYAGGWNYVWARTDLEPFWKGIVYARDPLFDLPVATILLVGVLSGLVPFAMKFFIFLAIKRYRENEIEHTPEAVAQRMVEPFQVQILATRLMNQHLLGLTAAVDAPLVMRNVEPAHQLADHLQAGATAGNALQLQGTRDALEDTLAELSALRANYDRLASAKAPAPASTLPQAVKPLLETLLDAGVKPERITVETEEPAVVVKVKEVKVKGWTLEKLLAEFGKSREEVVFLVGKYTNKTAEGAYSRLKSFGYLPKGLTFADFAPLFRELMDVELIAPAEQPPAEELAPVSGADLEPCNHEITNADKSVCTKDFWTKRLGKGVVMCKACRELRR